VEVENKYWCGWFREDTEARRERVEKVEAMEIGVDLTGKAPGRGGQ
jgi:hypothetical protein